MLRAGKVGVTIVCPFAGKIFSAFTTAPNARTQTAKLTQVYMINSNTEMGIVFCGSAVPLISLLYINNS